MPKSRPEGPGLALRPSAPAPSRTSGPPSGQHGHGTNGTRHGTGRAWPVRGPVRTGLLVLAAGFAGALVFAATAQIDGAVIAPGSVGLETRLQAVQHPDGGLVAALGVRDGGPGRGGRGDPGT